MGKIIATVLLALTSSVAMRVLTTLGFGFMSYSAINGLVSTVISHIHSSYGESGDVVISLLNMSGFGTAINILCAAIITKATMIAVKKMMPI
jgi:Protein of unknown function (DUF2523)